ncbi:MAG: glycosyltransferase family 2 protein [Ignavibacteriales bacterium]|nr:glycosyltransferase family 2 protein [Ignavibacteriales bacterium]
MKLSGFSFIRNGIRFDYPFVESISSILPICGEFVVAVGAADDDTIDRLRTIRSPKIKIIETVWDDSMRTGGAVLAQQTNIALSRVTGDWAFYLQADEVVHENDLPVITSALDRHHDNEKVEGLLFSYKHFYGSYRYVGTSRRWYRHEIRIVRNGIGVQSWGDAQGFRTGTRKLRVKPVEASIYHYGWVKPPRQQQEKQRSFNRLWHPNRWVEDHVGRAEEYDYSQGGKLTEFAGTHPRVMKQRVEKEDWNFTYDPARAQQPAGEKLLDWIEGKSGIRLGEYRNYTLL